MGPTHILVAEDDNNILTGLIDTLESEGYEVTPASNGRQAIDLFRTKSFDLILLDVMMPEKSGFDVCRDIRLKNQDVPVIMLTAKGEEIDKVVGLQLGADDYITKPFGVRELLARIEAVLRRSKRNEKQSAKNGEIPDSFSFGDAEVESRTYKVRIQGNNYDISDKELKLIKFFYLHPNEVLSRNQLLNAVWGIEYYGTTRTLDQHIAKLRKKIENNPGEPSVITTVHGVGYRFEKG